MGLLYACVSAVRALLPPKPSVDLSFLGRTCLAKGNPATPILDVPHDLTQRRELFQRMSPRLKFELKLQDVLTRFCIAVSQNGLRTMSAEQERSLDTLLSVFQAQVSSVSLDHTSGRFLFSCYPPWSASVVQRKIL